MAQPIAHGVGFEDIPYDIQLEIWKTTLDDESRVVLADAVLKEGTTMIQHDALKRDHPKEFLLDIFPNRTQVARLAATFFHSDLTDPTHLKAILDTAKSLIFESKNILFIGDLEDVLGPLLDEIADRRRIVDNHAILNQMALTSLSIDDWVVYGKVPELLKAHPGLVISQSVNIRSLALYTFRPGYLRRRNTITTTTSRLEEHLLDIVVSLKELEVVYLVLDTRAIYGTAVSFKPRFIKGATGVGGKTTVAAEGSKEAAEEIRIKNALMVHYQRAWNIKAFIHRGIKKWNDVLATDVESKEDIGTRKFRTLDVQVVQWEM